jgi:hypothetical protein
MIVWSWLSSRTQWISRETVRCMIVWSWLSTRTQWISRETLRCMIVWSWLSSRTQWISRETLSCMIVWSWLSSRTQWINRETLTCMILWSWYWAVWSCDRDTDLYDPVIVILTCMILWSWISFRTQLKIYVKHMPNKMRQKITKIMMMWSAFSVSATVPVFGCIKREWKSVQIVYS